MMQLTDNQVPQLFCLKKKSVIRILPSGASIFKPLQFLPPLLVFFTNKPKCLTAMQSMHGLG